MDRILNIVKENLRLLLGIAVVLFVVVLLVTLLLNKKSTAVVAGEQTFRVRVAETDKDRQIGLSNKNKLGEDEGMLFVFDKPDYYSFWMKEMKFPIDIVYLNGDKVITVIENALPPLNNQELKIYQPTEPSDRVLEIKSGLSGKYNIKKGTSLKINNL